jgi:hypothetical protein
MTTLPRNTVSLGPSSRRRDAAMNDLNRFRFDFGVRLRTGGGTPSTRDNYLLQSLSRSTSSLTG